MTRYSLNDALHDALRWLPIRGEFISERPFALITGEWLRVRFRCICGWGVNEELGFVFDWDLSEALSKYLRMADFDPDLHPYALIAEIYNQIHFDQTLMLLWFEGNEKGLIWS